MSEPMKEEPTEPQKKMIAERTQVPDSNLHKNDTTGKEPTEVPDSSIHRNPAPTAVASDAMSGATGAE